MGPTLRPVASILGNALSYGDGLESHHTMRDLTTPYSNMCRFLGWKPTMRFESLEVIWIRIITSHFKSFRYTDRDKVQTLWCP